MKDRDQETLNQIWDLYHSPVITSGKLRNRLLYPVRVLIKLLLGPILARQAEYNAANTRIINEVRGQLQGLWVAMEGVQQQGLERHHTAIEQVRGQLQALRAAIEESREHACRAERKIFSFFREVGRQELPLAQLAQELLFEFDYFAFEQQFRGSEEEIGRRQRIYLEYFGSRHDVLDIGCGRGEFLALLREIGVKARGIDRNLEMVEHCRRKGLEAEEAEAFEYLYSQANGSLGGIFMAQVIEHLPFETLNELIKLCYHKLAPHGVLIAETLNPHCPTAMRWFYLDPTHLRPIFPEMLEFLCTSSGFQKEIIRYTLPQIAPAEAEGK